MTKRTSKPAGMSVAESPSPEPANPLELAKLVSAHVQIQGILLVESIAKRAQGSSGQSSIQVRMEVKDVSFDINYESRKLFVFPRFELIAERATDSQTESVVSIQALFSLEYSFDSSDRFSDE